MRIASTSFKKSRPAARTAIAVAAGALVLSALQGSAAAAAGPGDPEPTPATPVVAPKDSDGDHVLDAEDQAAAAAGAVAADEPVEDLSHRTETATVVANPDGTFTRTQYGTPVRIKRDDEWVDVDYTLQQRPDGSYAPKASPVGVAIGGGGSTTAASVTFNNGQNLAVNWHDELPAPTVNGSSATYALSDTTSLVVSAVNSGVSTHIVLKAPPADDDPVFKLGLTTTDIALAETAAGGINLTDSGKRIGSTGSMVAWDATVDEAGEPSEVVNVGSDLDVVSRAGDVTKHELDLTTPDGFLSDPSTQYPVTIDPDVVELTQSQDTWVREGDTMNRHLEPRLIVGKIGDSSNTNAAIAYAQWVMPRADSAGLVSAEMDLYQYFAGSCNERKLVARPLAESWGAGSAVYTNRPSFIGSTDASSITTNRGAGCSTGAGIVSMDVTDMARQWLRADEDPSKGYSNFGLRLDVGLDNEGYSSYERRFCSFASGKSSADPYTSSCDDVLRQPKMTFVYNNPPSTPAAPSVTYGSNPVTVTAEVKDPNKESALRSSIVVRDQASTVVFQKFTDPVSVPRGKTTGTPVTLTLPYLPDGDYTVYARTYDDLGRTSAASATTPLKIDTEFGSQSWYSVTQHQLGDRSSIQVNNRTGNLVVQAGDISVNGLGVDLGLTRFYNSQSTQTKTQFGQGAGLTTDESWPTAMGNGWSLSAGPDVWLEKRGDNYWYHAPGGTVFGPFTPESGSTTGFKKPAGGVDADLKKLDDNTFRLSFRHSQTRYDFTVIGATGDAFQTVSKDRSENKVQFAYSGTTPNGRPKLTTITDSVGRTYTVTYTGDSITSIGEDATKGSDARTWSYGYDSNNSLSSYTNPAGEVTKYTYAEPATATGSRPMTKIEDPQSASSAHPTTTFDYFGDEANVDRVNKVHYAKASGAVDYEWDYDRRSAHADCNSKSDYSTRVFDGADNAADPRGERTAYCFKDKGGTTGGAQTRVYDPANHVKQSDYTLDRGVGASTAASNMTAVTGGSTVATYGGANLTDQMQSVTEPKTEGDDTAGTTTFQYGDGEPYQPNKTTGADGRCSSFSYDDAGRTTAAYTGLAGDNCSQGSKTGFHRDYNSNGTVARSWDANAYEGNTDPSHDTDPETPGDENATTYTYWPTASSDADYHYGWGGQVRTIRKPRGSCDSPRKLCTSYTYDRFGRVKTVTDGRGKVTTYAYDELGRTTQVRLDGATVCPSVKCVSYTYDAEGNMTSRVDKSGTTAFSYDRLNRQTRQVLPDGTQIDLTYDDNGNLTQHKQTLPGQSADTVAYAYDKANRLTNVTDASGTINVATDADGRVKQIKFPGPNPTDPPSITADYDFKRSGKPKTFTVTNQSGAVQRKYTYDYTKRVTVPLPTSTGALVVKAVEMESNQVQKRTQSSAQTGNGTTAYTYDDDSRLIGADNDNSVVPDYGYSYDNVGNVTKENIDSTSTYFGYDKAGQLCWRGPNDETGSNVHSECQPGPSGASDLSHDAAGNNTGTSANPRTYNDNSQLTNIGGVDMSYSDLGNPIRTQAGTTTFVNSPLGVTARKVGSAVTYYTRDPNGQVLSSHGAGGTVNYVSEYNGSVAALYSPAGAEVGSYHYSPYGQTTVTGADAGTNPFRYIGGYQDKDSSGADGYYKFGARYYDSHGHFTQPDSVAGTVNDPKTLTSYNYAAGDPINSADPSGNSFDEIVKGAGEVSQITDAFSYGKTLASGDVSEIVAETGGLLTSAAVTTGCEAAVGSTGVGAVYCLGLSGAIGNKAESGLRSYGKSAQW